MAFLQIPLWILVLDKLPKWLNQRRVEYELKQDEFYYGVDFEAKANLLDNIVQEEIDRYYVLELGYKKPEEVYLNEDQQKELIRQLTQRIFTLRMTNAVMANISFYYNFNSEKDLLSIIMGRVSFGVLNLTLQTNTTTIKI